MPGRCGSMRPPAAWPSSSTPTSAGHLGGTSVDHFGIGYSRPLLEEARRHYPQIRVAVADAGSLPFRDAAFDVVLSAAVIMHVPDWRQAIREMARVSKSHAVLHRTPV